MRNSNDEKNIWKAREQRMNALVKNIKPVDSSHIQLPERKPTYIATENPEEQKARILPCIKYAILSTIYSLSKSTQEKLLSGGTIDALALTCKEKYDQEFDLNFPSLGIAGAHEIAWHEVFSEFDDEVWE